MSTFSNITFKSDAKPKRFEQGQVVVFTPAANSTFRPAKSFAVLVTENQTSNDDFSGVVIWSLPEMTKSHPVGSYSDDWNPDSFTILSGSVTLASE
jgi:hypothetical protein